MTARNVPHGFEDDQTLDYLGRHYGTDKSSWGHDYLKIYERYLADLRNVPIRFLELGWWDGASVQMWRDYFNDPSTEIFGVDIEDKEPVEGVEFRRADQTDAAALARISDEAGGYWDVVVDDASHLSPHTVASFKALWPRVWRGGFYFVEDLQVSYHPDWMGWDPTRPTRGKVHGETTMEFLKSLADAVHFGNAAAGPTRPVYEDVAHVAFYPGLCVVQKVL